MRPDFEVDTEGVRDWAAALTTASGNLQADPPSPVPGPHWSATDAGTVAAAAAQRALAAIANDIITTGRAAAGAAGDYEAADASAAARLRAIR
ncbi:hypothetical protein [Couchioplanes caeruleus]|uniref:Excreted virulence factor EspC (Type VII ESX diderm) n=2 Tax=Couchioplanes caeruleus TaxID=56438 RepID=A0A1K0FK37_9ACTN|nr:hypothetical protein [Couchioplanes caeruleus]OJF13096.1 hypothetical protein BG844_17065 [Couchioplanes caeruleus subsp. caeruleus]ROP30202.1 hypothetical protein EDD30_3038 [Couchioplanes caeruleus]